MEQFRRIIKIPSDSSKRSEGIFCTQNHQPTVNKFDSFLITIKRTASGVLLLILFLFCHGFDNGICQRFHFICFLRFQRRCKRQPLA